jgi:hypothetical protein
MRFLLTSAGIKNASIHDALVDLLGKPIPESNALCIPTATHAFGQPELAWRFISGQEPRTPMCELRWKSLGVLELTALPSIDEERWVPIVQETDVLRASSVSKSGRTAVPPSPARRARRRGRVAPRRACTMCFRPRSELPIHARASNKDNRKGQPWSTERRAR